MQICKRIIAMLLALTLTLSCCPIQVFATDGIEPSTGVTSQNLDNNEKKLLDNLNNELKDASNLQSIEPNLDDNQAEMLDKLKDSFSPSLSLSSQDLTGATQTKAQNNNLIDTYIEDDDDLNPDDELDKNNGSDIPADGKKDETEIETQSKITELSGYWEERDASISIVLPNEHGVNADSILEISNADPSNETMIRLMGELGLNAVLDCAIFEMKIDNQEVSDDVNIAVSVKFENPSLKAVDEDYVYVIEKNSDEFIFSEVRKVELNAQKSISAIEFGVDGLSSESQFILLSSDSATATEIASVIGKYAIQGFNKVSCGSASKLKDITYHYVGDKTNPAYCIEPHKSWGYASTGGASTTIVQSSGGGSGNGATVWSNLSSNQRKAIALIVALNDVPGNWSQSDYDSFSQNLINPTSSNQCRFAAGQIMVWEVVDGLRKFPNPSTCSSSKLIDNWDRGYVRDYYDELNDLIEEWYYTTSGSRVSVTESEYQLTWVTSSTQTGITAYNIEYEVVTPPTGDLYITKSVTGGGSVSNWLFYLYNNQSDANAGNSNWIDYNYTNSSGRAYFCDLSPGTYYVREAPANKQSNNTSGCTLDYTVKSVTVVAGTTQSAGTITNTYKGNLSITKSINPSSLATSTNLSGWVFELYGSSANATNRTNRIATATTNTSGVATFSNLIAGTTYYIREAPLSEQNSSRANWTVSSEVKKETVVANTTTSVGTITNTAPKGSLSVTKAIKGPGSVSGWIFELYASDSDAKNRTNRITTAKSGSNGVATFSGLDADKTYYIREAPASNQTAGWTIPATVLNGKVVSGDTISVGTITNESPAKISVSKTIAPSSLATSENLSGWVFELYNSDEDARNEVNVVKSAETNSSGIAYFNDLTPGTYHVREASAGRQNSDKILNGWKLSETILPVDAKGGAINYTSAGTVTNTATGSLTVSKEIFSMGDISFDKNDWRFEIYRSEADAIAGTNYIDAKYSNADGVATFEGLADGVTYFIREAPIERQDRKKDDIQGWGISEDVLSKTVAAGEELSVGMVFNMPPSQINGRKEVYSLDENSANSKRANWVFEVATDAEFKNIVATPKSDESGNWETGYILSAGSYYVREALAKDQIREDINDFVLDNTATKVTVVGGGNVFVIQGGKNYYTSQNIEKGQLQIKKAITGVNETSATLSGWVIKVYSDANCTVLVDTIVTGANGLATSKKLAPGQYWVKEAPKSQQTHSGLERWTLDSDVVPVTINAGITTIAYDSTSATFTNFYQTGRVIKLTKVSDNVANEDCFEQIKDNAMYSLEGAEYNVVVNGIVVETLVTDKNGLAISNVVYNSGITGYLVETKAPQGYLLDETLYPFVINSGDGYCEITVADIPTFDPFAQSFQKADAETKLPQGSASFEGAIFRWDYYDNLNWSDEPTRTWYFKTNAMGLHGYHPNYLAENYNSDELYKGILGSYQLPLGSVKITEIVAPFGYVVFDQPFYVTIEQDAETGIARWAYTPETLEYLKNENGTYVGEESQDTSTFGSIEITKKDADYPDNPPAWTNFVGIEFTVYNKSANPVKIGNFDVAQPGEACAILVMNAEGTASLENIPVGQYEIRETKGNDFYNINTEWIQTFSIKNGNSFGFTCENTLKPEMAPGQIKGFKRIYSTNPNTAIAKQNGWLFEIATDINFTNVVATEVSDQFGNWETGYIFRAGTYYVREALLEDQILSDADNFVLDNTIIKVELVGGDSVVALQENTIYTSQNVEKGYVEIEKDVFGIEATSVNLKDWVVNIYSDANCTVLVESLITDENGIALSNRLIPGNYWIKEAPKSSQVRDDVDMWGLDETIVPVTVEAGAITKAYTDETATITNYYGKYIKLIKISDETDFDMSQLTDNDMYTLAGAEYQIIVDGEVVEILTTNENGVALSNSIYTIGTSGIIKEIAAPNGYLLDTQVHEFEVVANTDDYCEINVSDKPTLDSNVIQFKKIDAITGVAQGNMSFQGAIFRWDYYDNTNWDGEPVATWYFATDSDGVIGYHPEYLAENYNSDNLYISKLDTYQMPLGSIKITEEVAPNGYLVFEEPFYATIEQPAMGEQAKWNFTDKTLEVLMLENGMYVGAEPQDIDTFGSIEIQKADNETGTVAPGWATFEGIEFTIYNKSRNPVKIGDFEIAQPNEACAVIVIGADGKASLDNIPIGEYEIRETKGNDYYQVNEEWYCVFSVEDGNTFNFICHNTLKPAKISIEKLGTDGSIIAGAKFLLEWSIDGETDWAPVQYSDEIKMGYSSSVDADGCIVIDEDGIASFENLHPVIYYRITEVESPNGYQLLKDHIMVGQLKVEDNFEMSYKVINNTVFAMPKTGSIGFINMIPLFIIASLAMFCGVYVVTFDRKRKKI